MDYDFEFGRMEKEIKVSKAKIVGLQFPEGLKTKAIDIARELEKRTGCTVVIFADPCYGACDTKEIEADKLGVDIVFQFGHDKY